MPADCEKPITGAPTCGVTAAGRCRECGEAFCATHQAYGGAWPNTWPFRDWCAPCQAKSQAAERAAAAIAQEEAWRAQEEATRRGAAAARRIPALLEEFRSRPFRGEARTWTTRDYRGKTWWSQQPKFKERRHEDEPAVPIGELLWEWRTGNNDNPDDSGYLATGLTRAGKFVLMQPPHSGNPYRVGPTGHKLAAGQHATIELLLKGLLEHY